MSIKVQPNAIEMDMSAPSVIEARRCTTIMDKATLMDKTKYVEDTKMHLSIR
jgi:hypothetical protein